MAKPWRVHTVVFDLDDTLYPERDYVLSGFGAVDKWLEETHGLSGFAVLAGRHFEAGSRGKIFDECLPLVGRRAEAELIARMLAVYRDHEPAIRLFPDADRALERTTQAGRNIALITDGYAGVQARKIRALGLESRITCRIITDELGREHWKPSPEPFRRVMAAFPGPQAGYVYVGDNPRKDFIGCRQLGWRSVRMRRPGGDHATYVATAMEAAEVEVADCDALMECLGLV